MKTLESTKKELKHLVIGVALFVLVTLAFVFFTSGSARSATPPGAKDSKTFEVAIDNFSFGPATLTVYVGSKVTWTNRDDVPHTVTSTDQKFNSRALDTDEKFAFEFKDAGTFEYFCALHPRMTGKVIVK
jgi:plastocyanin